jgi:hypothetical protein
MKARGSPSKLWVLVPSVGLLVACGQQALRSGNVQPEMVVFGEVTIEKQIEVTYGEFSAPKIVKSAITPSVDATGGVIDVKYSLDLSYEKAITDPGTATIKEIKISNTLDTFSGTIEDELYCATDAVGGHSGLPVATFKVTDKVFTKNAAVVVGPFTSVDVKSCANVTGQAVPDVVNLVRVKNSVGVTVAEKVFYNGKPGYKEAAISGIVGARIVDEETLPPNWAVAAVSVTRTDSAVFAYEWSQTLNKATVLIGQKDAVDGIVPVAPAGTYTLTKTLVRAAGVACQAQAIYNDAWLEVEAGTVFGLKSSAKIDLTCKAMGCTYTIGFWKTHADPTPGNQLNVMGPLLPVWLGLEGGAKSVKVVGTLQGIALLEKADDASNGINKLYAQLFGAKLNIKNGADGTAIADLIVAADKTLASVNALDWSTLKAAKQNQILNWALALDRYNNGLDGPGHCQ